MSENKKAINEFFFKKKETYADKLKRKLPQYEPQDVKSEGEPKGFGGILAPTDKGLAVTDPREAGKRVVSALGASIGVNSVRQVASKSIKSFPIVISESVDPETSVMLKRVLEEQYAEYMSLLISNQVVDISAYKTGEKEGNVAIQALGAVSSEDEAKMLARKAASGEIEPEDFLKNLTAYNLVRNEGKQYRTGNETLDTLLEGAVIVPAEDSKSIVEFMVTHSDEIAPLTEATDDENRRERGSHIPLDQFLKDDLGIDEEKANKILAKFEKEKEGALKDKEVRDARRFVKYDPFKKENNEVLETPGIFLDASAADKAISGSLGNMILDPKNEAIRDRFEKATFLLQANRISGKEWIEYLFKRLGIPVSRKIRQHVINLYPYRAIVDPSNIKRTITRGDIRILLQNRRNVDRTLMALLSYAGKEILAAGLTAGLVGGAAFGIATLAAMPLALILGAVAGVSAAAVSTIVRRQRFIRKTQTEGWERVEALIESLEEQQNAVRRLRVVEKPSDENKEQKEKIEKAGEYADDNITASAAEVTKALEDYSAYFASLAKNAKPMPGALAEAYLEELTEEEAKEILSESSEMIRAAFKDNKEHEALVLSEALVSTKTPVELVATQSYEFDPKKAPEVLVVPKFTTRSQYAYGSTEYEKKDLKDRRYNAPLLMTIKFKERFDDGTFSDNELVAVIGILGVVTRVPSKEMDYILASNAEGKTLKGILEPDGDPAQMISNIIGIEKIRKDVDNLPISKDVWQNLEKISRLAVANSLAGRKNDNIANAHIVFAQKEIDNVRADMNVDYMKDIKLVRALMKRYSAFTVMIANDVSERIFIFDNLENVNWDVVPYSSFRNKDSGEQLNALLSKMSSGRL